MEISIEISYYPLSDKFLERIENFIRALKKYPHIKTVTNGMSTQIFGNYEEVMNIITVELKRAMKEPHAVFVMKVINARCDSYPNI
ncbi:MAG: hypothetical protein N2Z72_03355 [Bacteroidales bacterium]|nr:hypothetical protein [Bacteroidales bacterium]